MEKILEIDELSYQDIDKISLSFNDKSFYSIIGSNNCGKTTLFKLISGIIPSNDAVYYNNILLNHNNRRDYIVHFGVVERVNKKSFLFKTVLDEMIFPLNNLGYSKNKSLTRIKEVLNYFDTSYFLDKDIIQLDYYEKQLLLIMIALLHQPNVLLIDNVLGVFPSNQKYKIFKVLKKLVNSGMIIINFTTSLEEAYLSDRFFLMDNYKINGEYTRKDIYLNDQLFYEHNLEIPFMVDLSIKLKMYNLIDKEYINMKEMVDDIWP